MVRVLCHLNEDAVAKIAPEFPAVEFRCIAREGELDADIHGDVLLTSAIGAPTLAAALERGVRWVHTVGTGVDRFPLDLIGAGQILTCSRGASAVPIAEWCLAMMLAFEKKLPEPWLTEAPAQWFRVDPSLNIGTLAGCTLGIVGMGSIGERAARLAAPFDMRTKGLRRSLRPAETPGVEIVATLREVLDQADHVLIAAPLTGETRHMIDTSALAAMKPGVHIVNIARGGLIDQDALRAALDSGHVARASLDTVDPEPLPAGHWMYEHPRVRLSPHVSWLSPDIYESLYDTFRENLHRFVHGEPLRYVVDLDAGY